AFALDGNAVLRASQFILQPQEVFVRLQLRIVLYDEQQAAQSAIQLAIGGDLLLRSAGREQRRPRFRDVSEDGLLLLRVSLHRLNQVWNQVGTTLQDDIHLRPRRFHGLVLGHERVPRADIGSKDRQYKHADNDHN